MGKVYLNIEVPVYKDTGVTITQAVIDAVQAGGPIDSRIEGRITRLD